MVRELDVPVNVGAEDEARFLEQEGLGDWNGTSPTLREAKQFEAIVALVVPGIYTTVVLIGFVGNILVVLVTALSRSLRSSTGLLIGNLALFDLLFLVFCVPFTAIDYATTRWVFPHWWCPVLIYLQFCSAYGSVWTLVLLSADRYLAVIYPVSSRGLRTARNTALLVLFLWGLIFGCCVPILGQYSTHRYTYEGENRSSCLFTSLYVKQGSVFQIRAFYLSYNLFGYLLPLVLSSLLYFHVIRKLWIIKPGVMRSSIRERVKSRIKVTRMLIGVILVFAISCFPLQVSFFLQGIWYPEIQRTRGFIVFGMVGQVLTYANSCLNPILYAAFSSTFRQGFFRIFTCSTLNRRMSRVEIPTSGAGIYGTFRDFTTFFNQEKSIARNRRRKRKKDMMHSGVEPSSMRDPSSGLSPTRSRSRKNTTTSGAQGNFLEVPQSLKPFKFRTRSRSSCPDLTELPSSESSLSHSRLSSENRSGSVKSRSMPKRLSWKQDLEPSHVETRVFVQMKAKKVCEIEVHTRSPVVYIAGPDPELDGEVPSRKRSENYPETLFH